MSNAYEESKLPEYKCHKVVKAFKIEGISYFSDGIALLGGRDANGEQVNAEVTNEWVARHNPLAGNYYVLYQDGYDSCSPAQAFEEGYILREPYGTGDATS